MVTSPFGLDAIGGGSGAPRGNVHEDILDAIEYRTRKGAVIFDMLKKGAVKDLKKDWFTWDLPTPVNRAGDIGGDFDRTQLDTMERVRLSNDIQIFRQEVEVPYELIENLDVVGQRNEYLQRLKRAKEILYRNIEATLVDPTGSKSSAQHRPRMGSLYTFIGNVLNGASGSNNEVLSQVRKTFATTRSAAGAITETPTTTTLTDTLVRTQLTTEGRADSTATARGTPLANGTSYFTGGTNRTFSISLVNDGYAMAYNKSQDAVPSDIYVGTDLKGVVSRALVANNEYRRDIGMSDVVQFAVNRIKTDYGANAKVMIDYVMNDFDDNSLIALSPSKVKKMIKRPMKNKPQGIPGDSMRTLCVASHTLAVLNPDAHFIIRNLTN